MFSLDPTSASFLDSLDLLLKIAGGIGGIILFIIGFRRYKKDQTWKRYQFVANEIESFNKDAVVRNAMFMLDWGLRYIELFPDKPDYNERFEKVDREIFKAALQVHELREAHAGKMRFTPTEVAIRDTFDHFLSYFEKFYQFVEAGLITPEELEPYLRYWVDTIYSNLPEDVREVIYKYIGRYKFSGTEALFIALKKPLSIPVFS